MQRTRIAHALILGFLLTAGAAFAQTEIDSTGGFPVTITDPGSYILTENLDVVGTNGIVISADDVYLDLNGFTISGDGSGNYGGITGSGTPDRTTVVDGTILGFGGWGIALGFDSRVEGVVSVSNGDGLLMGSGQVVNSRFVDNDGDGIAFFVGQSGLVQGNSIIDNAIYEGFVKI